MTFIQGLGKKPLDLKQEEVLACVGDGRVFNCY